MGYTAEWRRHRRLLCARPVPLSALHAASSLRAHACAATHDSSDFSQQSLCGQMERWSEQHMPGSFVKLVGRQIMSGRKDVYNSMVYVQVMHMDYRRSFA